MAWVEVLGFLGRERGVERFAVSLHDADGERDCELRRANDRDLALRLRDAAGFLARHPHPLLPEVVSVLEDGDTAGLLTTTVPAASLRSISERPWPRDPALEVIRQLAELLAWLGSLRAPDGTPLDVTLRGLSSATVWVARSGALRVTGLEQLGGWWQGRVVQTLAEDAQAVGPAIAPEERDAPATQASAVYRLGVLAAELMLGADAGRTVSDRLAVAEDARNHHRIVNQRLADVAPEIYEILAPMLAFYPDERPTAEEVLRQVSEVQVGADGLTELAMARIDPTPSEPAHHSRVGERFGLDGDTPPVALASTFQQDDDEDIEDEPTARLAPPSEPLGSRPFGAAHDMSTMEVVYGGNVPRPEVQREPDEARSRETRPTEPGPSTPHPPPVRRARSVVLTVFERDGGAGEPDVSDLLRDVNQHRYALRGLVGAGAMGEVHLAEDPTLRRVVALKVMTPEATQHAGLTGRFVSEAQIMAQLDHPNIVPVYGLERTSAGSPAFAMKLVEGRDLEHWLDACRAAPDGPETSLATRLEHFTRVCDGMSYAHSRGVVHRDIKPANLMLGEFNEVYVMDWGIARVVGQPDVGPVEGLVAPGRPATQVGTIVGTPPYMSPEQADGRNDELTPASDQYALGLVLFELASLRPALPGSDPWKILERAQRGDHEPLVLPKGTPRPADLAAIIATATALRPEDRYADVDALADDVRRYLRDEEVLARPYSIGRKAWRWVDRHPLVVIATLAMVAVIGLLLIGGQALYTMRRQILADAHERMVRKVVARVAEEGHAIDTQLLRYQLALDGLADSLALRSADGPEAAPPPPVAAFADDSVVKDVKTWETYGQPVSLSEPVAVGPVASLPWNERKQLLRLLAARRELRNALLAEQGEATTWDEEQIQAYLGEEGSPIAWSFVGLPSGVLINFPGTARFSEGYDPTRRSWYLDAAGENPDRPGRNRRATWGEPYINDSGLGILLPCTRAVTAIDDTLLGVAGLDLRMDAVIESMEMEGVPGVTATWLVDERGRVVVDSDDLGMRPEGGLHDNAPLPLEDFPDPTVTRRILAGEVSGLEDLGAEILVFSHLPSVGWYYVVRAEESVLAGWDS